jgi:hypothetical protein
VIQKQIMALNKAGDTLLDKGQVKLALDAYKSAREISREYQHDSARIFAQFVIYAKIRPSYLIYIEFAARNGLEALSEYDYNLVFNSDQDQIEGTDRDQIINKK